MRANFVSKLDQSRWLPFIFIIATSAVITNAQSPSGAVPLPSPTPTTSPTPTLERRFVRNILRDQRMIWTSPFRLDGSDARYLAPLGAATVALIATDRHSAGNLSDDNGLRLDISRGISQIGALYTTGGVAAGFYLIGRNTGNERARETGLLSLQALTNTVAVYKSLKLATQRPRPRDKGGHGRFFDGGQAFPSGHAANAWAVATVIAKEYENRPLVRFGAYGLATAVSVSRFTGRKHFLSDVLVGSAIGYGIGHYVFRTYHDQSLDPPDKRKNTRGLQRLLPFVAPVFEPTSRTRALMLSWSL